MFIYTVYADWGSKKYLITLSMNDVWEMLLVKGLRIIKRVVRLSDEAT